MRADTQVFTHVGRGTGEQDAASIEDDDLVRYLESSVDVLFQDQ
jgi:hypothetical protein